MALVGSSFAPVALSAAPPEAALTVDGVIESTSGGFRFPDGSVQTTAVEAAAVPDTGLQGCWDASGNATGCSMTNGQDGELQRGLAWPAPRFTDNGDGTVTDELTGLVWLRDADCTTIRDADWETALSNVHSLMTGACGLSDGSMATDWRLPNVRELTSLVDYGENDPALPSGHPFLNVQSDLFIGYWTSTSVFREPTSAWDVKLHDGNTALGSKGISRKVWAVRGGQ